MRKILVPIARLLEMAGLFIVFAATRPGMAAAQASDPIGDWFTAHKLAIRKTFDGSKEEQNPASFLYFREPTGSDTEFAVFDVAVKLSEVELLENSNTSTLLLFPVVEYHRTTKVGKRINKYGFTGKAEWRPFGITAPPPPGGAIMPPKGPGVYLPVAPTLILEAKQSKDWESKTSERKFAAMVLFTSNYPFAPGGDWRSASGAFRGRYYPYLGMERHQLRGVSADTIANVAVGRVWLELWPIATPTRQYFQVTGDAAFRRNLSDGSGLARILSDFTAGANLYLDGNGHVGVGVDYSKGRDATQRFVNREKTSIGLKIKF